MFMYISWHYKEDEQTTIIIEYYHYRKLGLVGTTKLNLIVLRAGSAGANNWKRKKSVCIEFLLFYFKIYIAMS